MRLMRGVRVLVMSDEACGHTITGLSRDCACVSGGCMGSSPTMVDEY